MKIVFIGGRDIHKLGGIENYMYNLATQLVKKGHEPIVFCESDHNGDEWVNGFRVIHQKGPKSVYLCKIWLGIKATWYSLRKIKNVDFIHYNAWPPAVPSILFARLFGQKALFMGHGHGWQRTKYSPLQRQLMKIMEFIAVRSAKYNLMCSDAQTRYFKVTHNINCVTIPTAINLPDLSKNTSSDILSRFGLEKRKYFLYLARLVQDKNPDYLVRSFNEISAAGYKLVIAGNNPSAPAYVESLHKLAGNNTNIVFTDAVYGNDKETLLQSAYAYCIPSTIEGLSISLLEAMSYRLPIIASDIPANREVLANDTAFWVKPESTEELIHAFNYAIANPDLFGATSEFNYDIVAANYTWDVVSDKYIGTICQFLMMK